MSLLKPNKMLTGFSKLHPLRMPTDKEKNDIIQFSGITYHIKTKRNMRLTKKYIYFSRYVKVYSTDNNNIFFGIISLSSKGFGIEYKFKRVQ